MGDIQTLLQETGELQSWVLDDFLLTYQQAGVVFGWNKPGCHLWHSTGSGKTLSGIILSLSLPGPVLIITRSAAKIQFAREVERFTKHRAYVMRPASSVRTEKRVGGLTWREFFSKWMKVDGKVALVAERWKNAQELHGVEKITVSKTLDVYLKECKKRESRPFVVVGWEALTDHYAALMALQPACVLFDEMHMGKGKKRWDPIYLKDIPEDKAERRQQLKEEYELKKQRDGFIKTDEETGRRIMFVPVLNRASAAARLARIAQKRVALTATPVSDRVRDLWAQLDTIEPNAWGNQSLWMVRHADAKPGRYGGLDTTGSSNMDELMSRIDHVAHVVPAHEAQQHLLGMKRRQSVYLTQDDLTRPVSGYGKELRDARKRGGTAVLEVKLAQTASRKRKAILDMVGDCVSSRQKVVIFTGRRRDCEELGALWRITKQ